MTYYSPFGEDDAKIRFMERFDHEQLKKLNPWSMEEAVFFPKKKAVAPSVTVTTNSRKKFAVIPEED